MTAGPIGMVPSPPLPAMRSAAAFLVRARSFLAPLAYDALLRLCLLDIWLLFAGWVVMDVARLAGAEDHAVDVAVSRIVAFCDHHLVNAFAIGMILFVQRMDDEEVKGPLMWKELQCRTVMLGLYAFVPFFLLMIVGGLLEVALPVKGCRGEATGSIVSTVGFLGKNALCCFVIVPTLALKVWRMTRPGWGTGSTSVEKKSLNKRKLYGVGLGEELL
ncbi:hypothetical protein QOZ80_8BG0659510 [Eleusine coracana subsp. coracana]|nr:hypothetical protein QOZ80_8BG0659510 [Eleusine coracana subsp. coracana]